MAILTYSACISGIEGKIITVETEIYSQLNKFFIVGLGDTAVQEAKRRIQFAISNSGFRWSKKAITINLAPAQMRKEGSGLDLAMAVGILLFTKQITLPHRDKTLFLGELGLDGQIRSVPGVLAMLLQAHKQGFTHAYIPAENTFEASLVADRLKIHSINQLGGIQSAKAITPMKDTGMINHAPLHAPCPLGADFRDILGNIHAKRALTIAAAGGHNVLLTGPPGTGKSLFAKALLGILPPLNFEEMLDIVSIHSISGERISEQTFTRPFRSPHHSSSANAIIGGGIHPTPGEITLAHHGVLFLDEFSEYRRDVLESLREPLEEKRITISRTQSKAVFPAEFQLIAAMNPCACGFAGLPHEAPKGAQYGPATAGEQICTCSSFAKDRYHRKLSGPILDRIDLFSYVPRLPLKKLWQKASVAESSSQIKTLVSKAHELQIKRQGKTNANLKLTLNTASEILQISKEALELMTTITEAMQLSPRGLVRLLKVSRTIADLDGKKVVLSLHLKEAINFRQNLVTENL